VVASTLLLSLVEERIVIHDKIVRGNSPRLRGAFVKTTAALAACAFAGCALMDQFEQAPDPDPGSMVDAGSPGTCSPSIDRFKELVVVDPGVVNDVARTTPGGAWSFRHLVENMKPEGALAPDFVMTWLNDYKATSVNGFPVSVRGGVDALVAAWPKTSDGRLDLDQAPFRLIAITNRLDLRDKSRPDSAGEGRLVFAALQNGFPTTFTLIFEYLLPTDAGKDPAFWAASFHALGAMPSGEPYNRGLESVTRLFTERNAAPTRINGSAIGQVRSNEILFASPWELREFRLDASGALRIAPTDKCPDSSLNGSAALTQFVFDNEAAVRAGTHRVPLAMLGGACQEAPANVWQLPGVPEDLRHLFARETCNGCHSAEEASKDGFYHISPSGIGVGRLSRFLHDPQNTGKDELSRRSAELAKLLCNPNGG
jgi:hypothetical protein